MKKTLKAELIEALLQRLPTNHPQRGALESDLSKSLAGFYGEVSVLHSLEKILGDGIVLHDLHFSATQFDILLITPSYFLILEVKNIGGEIYFDDQFQQLIRVKEGETTAFDDPILQVQRQCQKLQQWLTSKKLPLVPIESFVVSANPATIVRASNKNIAKQVVRKNNLAYKIAELNRKHNSAALTKKQRKRIAYLLNRADEPYIPNLLTNYQISVDDLLVGVSCPDCRKLAMKRQFGTWHCPYCLHKSKDAHLTAIRDYALLIKPTITNRELRYWIKLESESSAQKMLKQLNLHSTGTTKNRVYQLNWRDFPSN